MEITVKIPGICLERKCLEINETEFKKQLISFVDQLENKESLDKRLYDKFIEYGIDQAILDQMIERIKVFSSYDDEERNINFPYEDWIPKLLEYYEEKQ